MKKILYFTLCILSASALVACGGSASSDSSGANYNPVTPTINPPKPNSINITGKAIVTDDTYLNRIDRHDVVSVNSSNIDKLNIGGTIINLVPYNTSASNFTTLKTNDYTSVVSGTHLSHAKYGFYEDSVTKNEYYFYQGSLTPISNMPTIGIVKYNGYALHGCDRCSYENNIWTSSFDVDFGKKSLTGVIKNTYGDHMVSLQANISGNTFSGTDSRTAIKVDGAFFGDNAQELSGTYTNGTGTQRTIGIFGAKNTKQPECTALNSQGMYYAPNRY